MSTVFKVRGTHCICFVLKTLLGDGDGEVRSRLCEAVCC